MAFGLNHQATVDEIFGRFVSVWNSTGFQVIFPDVPLTALQIALIDGAEGVAIEPWARLTIRTTSRTQGAFGSGQDARRFDEIGLLICEVYAPIGSGMKQCYTLCELIKNAYEGVSTNNGVWYRNARIQEAGAEGEWTHANVLVDWESQEYK
jgi:hypothetical protein